MNVRRTKRRPGEPLIVMGAIMLCWIGARTAIWEMDRGQTSPVENLLAGKAHGSAVAQSEGAFPTPSAAPPLSSSLAPRIARRDAASSPSGAIAPYPLVRELVLPLPPATPASPAMAPVAPGLAGGHAMLWLAVVGKMPGPEVLLVGAAAKSALPVAPAPSIIPRQPASAGRRWSVDAWALVRGGGGVASAGPSIATYGGSQVGAVLRYRLAPSDPHRPTAFVRATAALNGSDEREVAAGLSVRPIPEAPVVIAAEGRVGRFGDRTLVRPAVMAVTELAPVDLPLNARAEFYLQGGYVGGASATPFVDGQLRIDKRVARVGAVELRAGGAAWGGAQRGAGRIDVGPSATLGIAKGAAAARVGLDWRFRVKGTAAPASGPALTISAGF